MADQLFEKRLRRAIELVPIGAEAPKDIPVEDLNHVRDLGVDQNRSVHPNRQHLLSGGYPRGADLRHPTDHQS